MLDFGYFQHKYLWLVYNADTICIHIQRCNIQNLHLENGHVSRSFFRVTVGEHSLLVISYGQCFTGFVAGKTVRWNPLAMFQNDPPYLLLLIAIDMPHCFESQVHCIFTTILTPCFVVGLFQLTTQISSTFHKE